MNRHKNHSQDSPAWRALSEHGKRQKHVSLPGLFSEDARRFEKFSLRLDDLLLDVSKTSLSETTLKLLFELAKERGVFTLRDSMFAGDKINRSEDRAVLHCALRAAEEASIFCDGKNIVPQVIAERRAMLDFAEQCRSGEFAAADGKPFSDVVNIGIGGSDLGPAMAVAALRPYHDGLRAHFVANMDGADLADTLAQLDAQRTLIVVSSKTFTTIETMTNAEMAKQWLVKHNASPDQHLAAATAAADKARQFGAGQVFAYGEWVGGRCSLWGAVGLPLALAVGKKHFLQFLSGAREMDAHFISAAPEHNIPLVLALVGVWHRNFCNFPTRAVLPYDQRLHLLPAYLQQLDMESNGKSVSRDAHENAKESGTSESTAATSPVVWGSAGTNAQHAYFQMLHQGTDIVPCEFIIAAEGHEKDDNQHKWLLANCFAQSAALMQGDDNPALPPQRRFPGNRPSVTILHRKLTPHSLGRLIALCEHRTFAEGCIWGVNSFDQWGVELGKVLAKTFRPQLDADFQQSTEESDPKDSSTNGLLACARRLREK